MVVCPLFYAFGFDMFVGVMPVVVVSLYFGVRNSNVKSLDFTTQEKPG